MTEIKFRPKAQILIQLGDQLIKNEGIALLELIKNSYDADAMNCTPKVRQKKSNFWGVFIMKLTYDDKVQIYELRKQGYSL